MPEDNHEKGRQGAAFVKRWLESTTFFYIPYDAYESPANCEIAHLNGVKQFDLAGHRFGEPVVPVYVESKNVTTAGDQSSEYRDFLGIAYGAYVKARRDGYKDRGIEYLWVTTHPFSLNTWSSLASPEAVRKAASQALAASEPSLTVDEETVRLVASRVWILVLSRRQEELLLEAPELNKVMGTLNRKKGI